jgi:hypothetical protein
MLYPSGYGRTGTRVVLDDQLWTPEDLEGARGLFAWGPPPPPSFLHPEDLAAMMTGAHSTR